MAANGRKGLIARWLEGKERSEDYARSTLPTNRWSLFWDILKGRLGKLVIVNLFMLISFLPVIALLIWRYIMISSEGAIGPYGSGLGIAYPMLPNIAGVAEVAVMQIDFLIFGLMFVAGAIASVGIAGGAYIIRNMVWTEGIFVANDFWRGVKRNYWNVLQSVMLICLLVFSVQVSINLTSLYLATDAPNAWVAITMQVVGYILLILGVMVAFWMISLGINYKQSFLSLFRNAIVMMLGTFPQTVFFLVIALLPYVLLLFGGLSFSFGIVLLMLLSFSFTFLVWMDYTQWAFDKFVNPKLGVKTGRGLYNKSSLAERDAASDQLANESAAMREYRREILSHGKSQLVSRPIRPIDDGIEMYQLPESFSREDLQRLRESRKEMENGVQAYEEEHKTDERYVEYNRQYDEMVAALKPEEKKKKKAPQRPKMLKKR